MLLNNLISVHFQLKGERPGQELRRNQILNHISNMLKLMTNIMVTLTITHFILLETNMRATRTVNIPKVTCMAVTNTMIHMELMIIDMTSILDTKECIHKMTTLIQGERTTGLITLTLIQEEIIQLCIPGTITLVGLHTWIICIILPHMPVDQTSRSNCMFPCVCIVIKYLTEAAIFLDKILLVFRIG